MDLSPFGQSLNESSRGFLSFSENPHHFPATRISPREQSSLTKPKRGPRGGVYDPFPIKLHRMLDQTEDEGLDSVVSWLSHGRAFKIHKPKMFALSIMPKFFNQSKYTSFQRQLNLYGE